MGTSAETLSAVTGTMNDLVPIKRVLVSVFDKTGVVEFCTWLAIESLKHNGTKIEFLSTGGTAVALRNASSTSESVKLNVIDVSDYTQSKECLNGRVKTLHPLVHGGLLAVQGNNQHEIEMKELNMNFIDMSIINLYPFDKAIASGDTQNKEYYENCIENIDIGGPAMIRSTAKNHVRTTIITSPNQYKIIQDCLLQNNYCTTYNLRKQFAYDAFTLTSQYDTMISTFFQNQLSNTTEKASTAITTAATTTPKTIIQREYLEEIQLKYGCNPYQGNAKILSIKDYTLPFTILNGTPGYINLLDACNAYQLVCELKIATNGMTSAASFKHVSPAGAAVAVPLTTEECIVYDILPSNVHTLTPCSIAYLRARNADPLCSYGDFAALSDIVDVSTALFLKTEVSDGIIAPGYTSDALEILCKKKGGKFIILQGTTNFIPPIDEYREVYGMTFCQQRNTKLITSDIITSNIVTSATNSDTKHVLSNDTIRDLLVASICIKYTQSNSVGLCTNGMMIGVGAGQQSRVDCVKLAGRKASTWYLRQHPKVINLPFTTSIKRQDRINARVRYIEGDFTIEEKLVFNTLFTTVPEPLTQNDKDEFLLKWSNVSISSDAFFPFRDSIDVASKYGVQYIIQPGGSVQDEQVINACNDYNIAMAFTNIRLFHH